VAASGESDQGFLDHSFSANDHFGDLADKVVAARSASERVRNMGTSVGDENGHAG
jgi:hypothetical protein